MVVLVNSTTSSLYRILAASDEDILQLDDGFPVQMLQDDLDMR